MRSLTRALVAIAALALAPAARAQQALLQGGPWTGNHAPMYFGPSGDFGQPILGDSGPAGGGEPGVGLSELGLTVQGTGTPPYADAGTGPYGANLCDYDAPITNATGYHYICLSPNAQGGESIIAGNGGPANPIPLQFVINGTVVPINTVVSGNLISGLQNGAVIPLATSTYALPVPVWSTYNSIWAPAVFNINNLPIETISTNGGLTYGLSIGLIGAVDTPSTDTGLPHGKVNYGVAGFARSASATTGSVGVWGWGGQNAEGQTAATEGLQGVCTNTPTTSVSNNTGFSQFSINCEEIDVNVVNTTAGAAPAGSATGLLFNLLAQSHPAGGLYGIIFSGDVISGAAAYDSVIAINDNANINAIRIGVAGVGNGFNSQSLEFRSRNSAHVEFDALLYEDQGGALNIVPGNANIPATTGNSSFSLNKPAGGYNSVLYGQTNSLLRWAMFIGNGTAESGSNVGSDYQLCRATDAGSLVDCPLTVTRSTGVIEFGAASFTANGSTALSLTSIGPSGAHATVQEWLTVQDSGGNTRYIPTF